MFSVAAVTIMTIGIMFHPFPSIIDGISGAAMLSSQCWVTFLAFFNAYGIQLYKMKATAVDNVTNLRWHFSMWFPVIIFVYFTIAGCLAYFVRFSDDKFGKQAVLAHMGMQYAILFIAFSPMFLSWLGYDLKKKTEKCDETATVLH